VSGEVGCPLAATPTDQIRGAGLEKREKTKAQPRSSGEEDMSDTFEGEWIREGLTLAWNTKLKEAEEFFARHPKRFTLWGSKISHHHHRSVFLSLQLLFFSVLTLFCVPSAIGAGEVAFWKVRVKKELISGVDFFFFVLLFVRSILFRGQQAIFTDKPEDTEKALALVAEAEKYVKPVCVGYKRRYLKNAAIDAANKTFSLLTGSFFFFILLFDFPQTFAE
jgi:hypothetical protein